MRLLNENLSAVRTKTTFLFLILITLFTSFGLQLDGQNNVKNTSPFSAGITTGYYRGYGLQADLTLHKQNSDIPFDLRLGFGYTFLNPGRAADARRIFVNNATNGEPEKTGRAVDYRLDFLFPSSILNLKDSYIFIGPRGSSFRGNFKFIGGNEVFDITSQQWGAGGGIESHFNMTANLQLQIRFGLDYYIPAALKGHDTVYTPDNDNINPRNNTENNDAPFTYKDADKAIYQPQLMPVAMIGLSFGL